MITTILLVLAGGWLLSSIAALLFVKKTFKRYKNYPRMDVPENMKATIRQDFGRWDEAAIIKGCFLRFPLHCFMMVTFLGNYGILIFLQKYLKFPPSIIEFFRSKYGRLASSINWNLVEEFDTKENINTPIIIANHVNWIDFIYMGTCLPPASFVAKIEVKKIPALGTIADYQQTLYVERSSPEARHRIKDQITQRARNFQQNPGTVLPLIIYPEGTVTNGRSLVSFKNGAFEPLCPISIYCLKYECKEFHLGFDEIGILEHAVISLCLKPTVRVYKEVVSPLPEETVENYRERCRGIVAEKTGFRRYDADYKDISLYEKNFHAFLKERRAAERAAADRTTAA